MKRLKGSLWVGVCLVLAAILLSCSFPLDFLRETKPQEPPEEYYVGFAGEENRKEPVLRTKEMVDAYRSEFSPYSASVYYDALSPGEQTVYRALEYALAKGYTDVILDERLLEDVERDLTDIVNFLSLDSPFLEQNLRISTGDTTLRVPVEAGEYPLTAKLVRVDVFTEEKREKKREALEAAREIVQGMPEGLLEKEIAEYYYDYLTQNVTYRDYESGEERHYLYDALVKGHSHCDGFANAYSLLCRLSGLNAFEKQVLPDEEGLVGHVWNSVKFDGEWYNVDCALGEESARGERENGVRVRFAFADELQTDTPLYDAILPRCENSLIPISLRFESEQDKDFLKKIKAAFEERKNYYILMELKSGEISDRMLNRIVWELDSSLSYILCDWNGSHYCFLIKKDG